MIRQMMSAPLLTAVMILYWHFMRYLWRGGYNEF